jgi:hypothetical protein
MSKVKEWDIVRTTNQVKDHVAPIQATILLQIDSDSIFLCICILYTRRKDQGIVFTFGSLVDFSMVHLLFIVWMLWPLYCCRLFFVF